MSDNHETRLIAEYCGDDALLRKASLEYCDGRGEVVDSEAAWTGQYGGGVPVLSCGLIAHDAEGESLKQRPIPLFGMNLLTSQTSLKRMS